ncbi:Fibrobacter succinogenes major paralogous domain [Candidatus Ornithobacterium hominis]|uniref:FISUMP domain-containing protein n=1 Tax=Candidatus Ornithobacterium hominis TaxID=2497989 RepID=UPI0024BCBFD9|nr:FISUMP domain-containing protein [Candidatus Ornithobacterium hominis]CAI9429203.1 Fibrobacter succinogenes major paralogous domain [Candidatus Ornithobacterium hominis]
MKKLLFSLAVLSAVAVTAQVGINTDTPQATLDISAKGKQEGDLRIEGVDRLYGVDWILTWDEKDKKVRKMSIKDIEWDIKNREIIDYIKGAVKNPNEVIEKIRKCPEDRLVYDKLFRKDNGKHDFVYCATIVTGKVNDKEYKRTWLNLNLGAEYANIHSPHFEPTVSKTGTDAHNEAKTYGSLYQWQRASDGHEFRGSQVTDKKASSWTETDEAAGKFITSDDGHWVSNPSPDLNLWQGGADRVNNPCPSGYHVPTMEEWKELLNAVGSNNQMYTQNKLPNLVAAGIIHHRDSTLVLEGSHGYYWSSSAYDDSSYAHAMYFLPGSGTIDFNYRSEGLSVRCIKSN